MTKSPMPSNANQLQSLLGALSCCREKMPEMATCTRPLNTLSKKGVEFVFTTEHVEVVQFLIKRLSSPDVLGFPDFKATFSGGQPPV